jgi:hypothetical protein
MELCRRVAAISVGPSVRGISFKIAAPRDVAKPDPHMRKDYPTRANNSAGLPLPVAERGHSEGRVTCDR